MSEIMTSIKIGKQSGLADWGRRTRAEMIALYRADAKRRKREAEEVLAAHDNDFIVEQYRGVIVQRDKKELKP